MKSEALIVSPGGQLGGEINVPGDKSISHRAVMLGAIANGTTEIRGCLLGEDVRATIAAFRAMGVSIEEQDGGRLTIHGRGFAALRKPDNCLDMGNSGTSIRLLCGLLAGAGFDVTMTGDHSLQGRPMRRVTDPLLQMGAKIETSDSGTPPLSIRGRSALSAIRYTLPMASAQVKSAVLLAALNATGHTHVIEPVATRDHTEKMLRAFGVVVETTVEEITLVGGQPLRATSITVPRDISSAAFFLIGAAIVPGSEVTLTGVGINPTRTGVLEILRQMGADIRLSHKRTAGSEPVADITIRGAPLHGIDVPTELIPSAIDEFPAIFIAAACAKGVTRLLDANELRHKESDRIDAMAVGLATLGVGVTTTENSIEIEGSERPLRGGSIDSRGDHRIAMAFAMAALRGNQAIEINDCAVIRTSFPGFAELARRAGLNIAPRE
jgi:3-phosphoshikimate 1-carboxyvinyltransferase